MECGGKERLRGRGNGKRCDTETQKSRDRRGRKERKHLIHKRIILTQNNRRREIAAMSYRMIKILSAGRGDQGTEGWGEI